MVAMSAPSVSRSHQARSASRRSNVLARAVSPSGPTSSPTIRATSCSTVRGSIRSTDSQVEMAGSGRAPPPGPTRAPGAGRVDLVVLGLAGVQRGDLRRAGRGQTAAGHLRLDLGPSGGKCVGAPGGGYRRVGDAIADRSPLDPEAAGKFGAQLGLVEIPGSLHVQIEPAGVERAVAVVGCPGQVRGQDMGVQVRVCCPARPVSERRAHEPGPINRLDTVRASPGAARLASRKARAAWTATSSAAADLPRSSCSASPNSTDTDFGARNVRSKPGTRSDPVRTNGTPSTGSLPANTAANAPASTLPSTSSPPAPLRSGDPVPLPDRGSSPPRRQPPCAGRNARCGHELPISTRRRHAAPRRVRIRSDASSCAFFVTSSSTGPEWSAPLVSFALVASVPSSSSVGWRFAGSSKSESDVG